MNSDRNNNPPSQQLSFIGRNALSPTSAQKQYTNSQLYNSRVRSVPFIGPDGLAINNAGNNLEQMEEYDVVAGQIQPIINNNNNYARSLGQYPNLQQQQMAPVINRVYIMKRPTTANQNIRKEVAKIARSLFIAIVAGVIVSVIANYLKFHYERAWVIKEESAASSTDD